MFRIKNLRSSSLCLVLLFISWVKTFKIRITWCKLCLTYFGSDQNILGRGISPVSGLFLCFFVFVFVIIKLFGTNSTDLDSILRCYKENEI